MHEMGALAEVGLEEEGEAGVDVEQPGVLVQLDAAADLPWH